VLSAGDAVGNRVATTTTEGVTLYEYDAANRLTNVDGVAYTWDERGNLLNDGSRTFQYDYANRLVRVVSGTLTTEFAYNGDGHRVAKTVNGSETHYTLDPAMGLVQVLVETTGSETTTYLYGHDLLAEEGTAWAWHLNDGLGSVRQLTDGAGQVTVARGYTPFGVEMWGEGSAASAYGFTGEQEDPSTGSGQAASTGLVFLRARYYDPRTGRFISKDLWAGSVWQPGTMNGWVYVGNNPVNLVDPWGLQGEKPPWWAQLASLPWRVLPQDFFLPGPLSEWGTWGGAEYAEWLVSEYYPLLPSYVRHDVGYVIGPELPTDRTTVYAAETDRYDITQWLIDQMHTDASSSLARDLNEYYPCPGAWWGWYNLVKGGAIWDFKPDISRPPGPGENIMLAGEWFSYDVPANIHYGYVGRAVGFRTEHLLEFAGLAQFKTHAIEPFLSTFVETTSLPASWESIGWENIGPLATYFDEPADATGIIIGVYLYESGPYVTEEKLARLLKWGESPPSPLEPLHKGTPQY
jgi:RHS repeat-associated protein